MQDNSKDINNQTVDNTKVVTGVQFSRAGKIEYYLAKEIPLNLHDKVVVKGEQGEIVGTVIVPPKKLSASEVATNIKSILRKATEGDIDKYEHDLERSRETFDLCSKKILEMNLQMKLVDVSLEGNKVVFYFFAEERVDFRVLVKDLANSLHMRIEMRQIGARDQAKGIGALGPCGIICCCSTHLREFTSISISMAKNQGLSPNPAKLTGMCGKLKCCMSYENQFYLDERKKLPSIGSKVKIQQGQGVVTSLDVPRGLCTVNISNSEKAEQVRTKCSECEILTKPKKFKKEDEAKVINEHEKLEEKEK